MLIFAVLAGTILAIALLFIALRYAGARRDVRLRPAFEKRLDLLLWTAGAWTRSCHDLAVSGYAERPEDVRLMLLLPKPGEHWYIHRHPTKGYRISVSDHVEGGRPARLDYPSGIRRSREPWLTAKLEHLHELLARLPPPRTHEEWMRKSREDSEAFAARMAEMDRELAAATIGFPSLDDPMDDMD